jgi:oligoribonuclease NrnB/cAMP/cGMP phosphodiesterase (DHH superfamily)
MSKDKSKKIVVIYHASCPDGFGSAWAAWKKFGNRAEYCAVNHADKPLSLKGREVYFLDLVYKLDVMKSIVGQASKVIVVDHHATAKDAVGLAKESLYDMNHSGAYLSWKYFHPGKAVPRLLLHIEDEDLWKFKMPHTAAVNARMELLGFDFKIWDKAIKDFEKAALRAKFVDEGELLREYRTSFCVRLIRENASPVKFLGYKALAVNAARPFGSEIGHMLCKMRPPLSIVWQESGSVVHVSLRSDGTVDVAKIAQRFGGGGHKAASGFNLPSGSRKPWTYEKSAKKK